MKHKIELEVELDCFNPTSQFPTVTVKSCLFQFRHGRYASNGKLSEYELDVLGDVLERLTLDFEEWLAEGNEDA